MARKVIQTVEFYDDLDKKPVGEDEIVTVDFAFQGKTYRIDLRDANYAKLEKALTPFIDAASLVSAGRGRPKGTSTRKSSGSGRSPEQLAAIRDWARTEGYELSDRGRIKAEIVEAFDAAH